MSRFTSFLPQRLIKKEKPKELLPLALRDPSPKEQEELRSLLDKYLPTGQEHSNEDVSSLLSLTCEVKSITNQAAILHGERIKKAQSILKKYRDGAFSAWLIATYGNRQTPYNFLQYYELYTQIAPTLRSQMDLMPRQAVYTLASRSGELTEKEKIIENYQGESKLAVLTQIRTLFPLHPQDKRREDFGAQALGFLSKLDQCCKRNDFALNAQQKKQCIVTLEKLLVTLQKIPTQE